MAYMGFKSLENKLSHESGVDNPAALAASIGRKKYGASAFNHAAASGTSLKRHAILKQMKKKKPAPAAEPVNETSGY